MRYLFFPLVIASIGVLAYFTFRTTIQIESLRRQSVVEASFALASEKADRLDRRLIEEGNVAMVLVDPEKPERLAENNHPTARRETPTVRGILLLNEQREVTGFASRSGNAWQEDEQFRSLLLRKMLGDMKLVEEPRKKLVICTRITTVRRISLAIGNANFRGGPCSLSRGTTLREL